MKGNKGKQGPEGNKGEKGSQGVSGKSHFGTQGEKGLPGIPGKIGHKGDKGENGSFDIHVLFVNIALRFDDRFYLIKELMDDQDLKVIKESAVFLVILDQKAKKEQTVSMA